MLDSPGNKLRGRDLHAGDLLESGLRNSALKGLREAGSGRKGSWGLRWSHTALWSWDGPLRLSSFGHQTSGRHPLQYAGVFKLEKLLWGHLHRRDTVKKKKKKRPSPFHALSTRAVSMQYPRASMFYRFCNVLSLFVLLVPDSALHRHQMQVQ